MDLQELENIIANITTIYKRQYIIYQQILKLSEEQAALNLVNNEEKLLNLINNRIRLVNNIEDSTDKLNELKNLVLKHLSIKEFKIKSIKEKLNSPVVEELADILFKLGEILKKINNLDDEFRQDYNGGHLSQRTQINVNSNIAHKAYKAFTIKDDKK